MQAELSLAALTVCAVINGLTGCAWDRPPEQPSVPAAAIVRMGSVRFRHAIGPDQVLFSPDGETLVSSGEDSVRLWVLRTGYERCRVEGPRARAIAFVPPDELLAVTTVTFAETEAETRVFLVDPENCRRVKEAPTAWADADASSFTADRETVVTGGTKLLLWDVATGTVRRRLEPGADGTGLAILADGRWLAISADGRWVAGIEQAPVTHTWEPDGKRGYFESSDPVHLWDTSTGKHRSVGNQLGGVSRVGFTIDSRALVIGASSNPPLQLVPLFEDDGGYSWGDDVLTALAISPRGEVIATGNTATTVHLWRVSDGQLLATFEGHVSGIDDLAFSPDGETLVSTAGVGAMRFWNVSSRQPLPVRIGHQAPVTYAAFSADGETVLSTSRDGVVRAWEADSGTPLGRFRTGSESITGLCVAGAPPRAVVLTQPEISRDPKHALHVWNWTSRAVRSVRLPWHLVGAISRDCTRAAVRTGETVAVFDVATATKRAELPIDGDLDWMSFSPDRRRLGTFNAYAADLLRVWDLDTGQELARATIGGFNAPPLAFSPAGNEIAAADPKAGLFFIDAASGARRRPFDAANHEYTAVAFSPDGARFGAARGRILELYDAPTGRLLAKHQGHDAAIRALAFSPDGTKVVTGSDDATLLLWKVAARRR